VKPLANARRTSEKRNASGTKIAEKQRERHAGTDEIANDRDRVRLYRYVTLSCDAA
jgi:hypothetical protein